MSEPRFSIKDYLDAKFQGVDQRFTDIDRRLTTIEEKGPRAGAFGVLGTFFGGALVAVLAYFGVGQKQ